MKEYKVLIPDEFYQLLKFKRDDLPGIAVINSSLKAFQSKEVFDWHCSIMVHFQELIENGMPAEKDRTKVEEFEDWLRVEIKGEFTEKPNALFLGRITWNKTRELIWRVHDPEKTNELLTDIIEKKDYDLPFDYRIDHDVDWKLAKWHLDICE